MLAFSNRLKQACALVSLLLLPPFYKWVDFQGGEVTCPRADDWPGGDWDSHPGVPGTSYSKGT